MNNSTIICTDVSDTQQLWGQTTEATYKHVEIDENISAL